MPAQYLPAVYEHIRGSNPRFYGDLKKSSTKLKKEICLIFVGCGSPTPVIEMITDFRPKIKNSYLINHHEDWAGSAKRSPAKEFQQNKNSPTIIRSKELFSTLSRHYSELSRKNGNRCMFKNVDLLEGWIVEKGSEQWNRWNNWYIFLGWNKSSSYLGRVLLYSRYAFATARTKKVDHDSQPSWRGTKKRPSFNFIWTLPYSRIVCQPTAVEPHYRWIYFLPVTF